MNKNDIVGYLLLNDRTQKNKRPYWNCTCLLCGNKKDIREDSIKSGKTISDGCYKKSSIQSDKAKEKHPIKDLTGRVYSELTVLYFVGRQNKKSIWACLCSCGKIVNVAAGNLQSGNTKSCGDYQAHRKKYMETVWKNMLDDLTGEIFGDWLVLERDGMAQPTRWLCLCLNCGTVKSVLGSTLKNGSSTSCGCKKHHESLVGKTIGLWEILERSSRIRPNGRSCTTYLCRCKNCGTQRYVDESRLLRGTSLSCGCVNSGGVAYIVDVLNRYKIEHSTEFTFEDLFGPGNRPLRFDIAILDKTENLICLIEYQGLQHYINGDYGRTQREITDPQKKEYCKKNNIPLYEIKYNDNIDQKLDEILTHITC